jgi:hypothetical protein
MNCKCHLVASLWPYAVRLWLSWYSYGNFMINISRIGMGDRIIPILLGLAIGKGRMTWKNE